MRNRLLALAAAVALVALAVVIRTRIGDDPLNQGAADPGLPLVSCTRDLVPVCEALVADHRILPFTVLDGAGAADPPPDVDGWITWDPGPALANFDVDPRGGDAVWTDARVVGATPIAVAGGRADLQALCPDPGGWSCLQGAVDQGLSVGVGDPATAEGIARLAPLARTYATDDDYTTLRTADLKALVATPTGGQGPASDQARLLVTRPGALDLVVGPQPLLQAEVDTKQGTARQLQVVRRGSTDDAMTAVLVTRAGTDADLGDVLGACDGGGRRLEGTALRDALAEVGIDRPCSGTPMDPGVAGFLYQVRNALG